jgi:hypothetical protein
MDSIGQLVDHWKSEAMDISETTLLEIGGFSPFRFEQECCIYPLADFELLFPNNLW